MILKNPINTDIVCDKAIKGDNFIHCHVNGKIVAEFNGITDFSQYRLIYELNNEYSIPFSKSELNENQLLGQYVALAVITTEQFTDISGEEHE